MSSRRTKVVSREVPRRARRPGRGGHLGGARPARPPPGAGARRHPDQADDDGTLTLSAFDYEVSAKITVAAEVAEAGTVLVLGRLLADISRNLPDRPIDVATDGSKVQVTCGSSRFSLLMMPADDYPTLPTSPEPSGTIDGHVFTQAVAQVSVAADRGDTLPILTGVRVEIEGDTMTLLATDRYRLAMRELHWNPELDRRQPRRADPGPHAVRHRALARAPAARSTSRSAPPPAATGWSASRPGSAAPPPACSTASTRRSPRSSPPPPRPSRSSRRPTSSRPSSAWRWSPSATPRCGCGSARARWPSRPAPATTPRRPRRSRPC